MKKKLIIFPFNGNGIEALDCLTDHFECIGFVDDTVEKQGRRNNFGIDVFNRNAFDKYKEALVLAVPGSPDSYLGRKQLIEDLKLPVKRFATIIHPTAAVSAYCSIGYNVLIMECTVIKASVKVGSHICILPNTVIHHDSIVKDYSLIGANVTIAGMTTIGDQCYIGSGTSVKNNITIGNKSLVGLGSNVIRNVPDNSKVAGNPAKKI